MSALVDKILALHAALDDTHIPHTFGGALALRVVHATRPRHHRHRRERVRRPVAHARAAGRAARAASQWSDDDRARIERDGQVRLWWGETPVDVFVNTTEFHDQLAEHCRWEPFGGSEVPFLGCTDLAVFKAFFDRTKDWADLEEMAAAGTLDVDRVAGILAHYLGSPDARIDRLRRSPDRSVWRRYAVI